MDLIRIYKLIQNFRTIFKKKKNKLTDGIQLENVPEHVAIIMDGNGRWAKRQGKPRTYGHSQGAGRIQPIIEVAAGIGVKCISFYAFSKENWMRPQNEVDFLMKLLENYLDNEWEVFLKNKCHLKVIGDRSMLSSEIQRKIGDLEDKLMDGVKTPRIHVNLAVSYGGKDEIVRAVNRCIEKKIESDKLTRDFLIDERMIESNLDSPEFSRIDLLIRTSGEQRISNFMLWQLAYSELYFTDVLWPDFSQQNFLDAVKTYCSRERRFGKI